ncbi:hypothetical protein [Flavobacterium haoranii]|uniref:Uncharacterized protein n=2 Tax=Flavobacterium haoranii TaxID=683124 RepID=A0A1M6H775_9FLAO|nr:hypothetical protein [Flavobacterium haoranii]SHJ18055.1 hypothetical protein SAMN05444337_1453 [Flavobacterium haoranii]
MEQKKKKSLIGTAITVAIMVIAVNFGSRLFKSKKELTLSNENTIAERAEIMNKDCPFTFDSNTRLDSVTSPEKNVLRQNYTLLNDSKSDIDTQAFEDLFKPEFKKNLQNQNQAEYFKKYNAKLVYRFYDKDKNHVTDIVLNSNEY